MSGHWAWQLLGWIALALNVWGNLALTGKSQTGWIVRLVSNACWLPYSVATSAWALFANHALFAGINLYGWWKWKRVVGHADYCGVGRLRNGVCNCGRLA
jgi:hypothetical protein